jgi:tripeptidyl-peptidase I
MVHASITGTLVLSLLSSLAAAAPSANAARKLVKESVNAPRGWTKRDDVPVPADYPLRLRIGLPQARFDELEKHLYEVSNPSHLRYGQHLSKVEVESLVAPHEDSLNAVDAWLASHGITSDSMHRSPAQDWVTIVVPISLAEEMLDTVRLT